MARKSRKQNKSASVKITATVPVKNCVGIYTRLSIEDNGYGTKDSIQNQIAFLKEYVEEQEDKLQLISVYVDNGTTGTNFDREEWNRMISDIKAGKINCVVVKDFSRLGRNYIEVGNYLEKIFPFLGTRIIAVNENFDSDKQTFENSMLMNSLTNIVNEYYARDISKKVTQTKRTMQRNGECVSGVVPYGYKKSDKDRKKLVVDKESADVVKKIFEWRLQKKGCTVIANYLNELAIPSPGMYRYMNGNQSFKRSSNAKWKSKHVAGILTNPVYLGHMVQGKTRCSYFEQDGKLRFLPKEDWIIIEGTHEPLVTQEQFDAAMVMAEESRKRHMEQIDAHKDIPRVENPLRKKIFCGQCGNMMTRRSRVENGKRGYCYFCGAPKSKIGINCTNTHIHEIPLMVAVTEATDRQLRLLGKIENHWRRQKQSEGYKKKEKEIENQKKKMEESVNRIGILRQEIYADMKEGLLSPTDYEYEKKRLAKKLEEYNAVMASLMEGDRMEKELEEALGRYRQSVLELEGVGMSDDVISIELLDTLIDKIVVYSPEKVEVTYSFADELEKWCQRLQADIPQEGEWED